jgi:hypothetical protein
MKNLKNALERFNKESLIHLHNKIQLALPINRDAISMKSIKSVRRFTREKTKSFNSLAKTSLMNNQMRILMKKTVKCSDLSRLKKNSGKLVLIRRDARDSSFTSPLL